MMSVEIHVSLHLLLQAKNVRHIIHLSRKNIIFQIIYYYYYYYYSNIYLTHVSSILVKLILEIVVSIIK